MLWCPKCKYEYEYGIKTCADCGEVLVERPEPDDLSMAIEQELLITVANDIEGDNVVALLDSCGIPAYCKHEGIGGYLKVFMGSVSVGGVDVYVLKEQLPQALEALEATGMLGEWEPLPDDCDEADPLPDVVDETYQVPKVPTDSDLQAESDSRKLFHKIVLLVAAIAVCYVSYLMWSNFT